MNDLLIKCNFSLYNSVYYWTYEITDFLFLNSLRFIIQILIQVGPILATINLLNGSDSFIHSSRTWLNMNHLLLEITNGQMTQFRWTLKWEKWQILTQGQTDVTIVTSASF